LHFPILSKSNLFFSAYFLKHHQKSNSDLRWDKEDGMKIKDRNIEYPFLMNNYSI
jgi:hypothetical protein